MNLNLAEKLKTGLTPQEKIDCYLYAISGIRVLDEGICCELLNCFDDIMNVDYPTIEKFFPEFCETKPEDKAPYQYWFNSTEERIEVLNKLIKEQNEILQNKG